MWAGVSSSQGLVTAQITTKKYEQRVTCSKWGVVVALCLLPIENTEFGKKLMISKWKLQAKSAVKVVANEEYTAKFENKITYEGEGESDWHWWLPTCECEGECTIVQCTIQRVQPDRGHHCENKRNKRYDSTIAAYTGTVQRWWSTPNWLHGHQGFSQLSTPL